MEADGEGDADIVADADTDGERATVGVTDGEREGEAGTDADAETLAATLGEPEALSVRVEEAVTLGDSAEAETVSEGERDEVAEVDADSLGEGEGETEAEKTVRSAATRMQSQPPEAPIRNSMVCPADMLATVPVYVSGALSVQPELATPPAGTGKA